MDTVEQLPMKGLTFGQAIERLKYGAMVARTGWKGMFLFIRPEFKCDLRTFLQIQSVPAHVKDKIIMVAPGRDEYKFTA